MATASFTQPRIEYRRFRSRSADADWDYFPFGRWGRGYRVNEIQRAKLRRFGTWIVEPAQLLISVLIVVAIAGRFVDYKDVLQFALVIGAAVTPFAFFMIAEWLYVRRLPPAERPLTLSEIHSFLALTQARGRTRANLIVGSIGTVVFPVGVLLETMRGADWPRIAVAAYCVVICAYLAWQGYCVRRLQPPLTLPTHSDKSVIISYNYKNNAHPCTAGMRPVG
jgi:purine-cytosine permease-like protein